MVSLDVSKRIVLNGRPGQSFTHTALMLCKQFPHQSTQIFLFSFQRWAFLSTSPYALKRTLGIIYRMNSDGEDDVAKKNTQAWEQMVLIQTADNKMIIQSRWNGRNFQVQESGLWVFANKIQDLWEMFDVKSDKVGKIYFISCHTGNVMQCDEHGFARCVNKNCLEREAWTIVYPQY